MSVPISPLERLFVGRELTGPEIDRLVGRLTDPTTTDVERAALLVAWRAKGETIEEIARFARALRARAIPFPGPARARAVDLCGSGGAPRPSFNVGTVSAFVVRAAGVPVAKHGNRSARGAEGGWAGSSDLLDALELPFARSRAFARAAFDRERITFLHAPLFHPATRAVVPVRRTLGVRTIFNLVGPLTNPAAVPIQIVGCPDVASAERIAPVLARLGVRGGMSVSSSDGLDEISARAPSASFVVRAGTVRRRRIDPTRWLAPGERSGSLAPLPPRDAARETERILAGGSGARRGSVLLTSAAALWVRGDARSFAEGLAVARAAVDTGAAGEVLARLRELARARDWPEDAP